MTLNEIKTMVRSYLTEVEIKTFGYDLRTREAWETLADRLSETIAAKADQALEVAKEVAIELRDTVQILADNCDGLPVAIAETAQAVLVWVMSQVIVGWLFCLEMAQEGAVDELLSEVQRLQHHREGRVMSLRSPLLSSTVSIQ